MDLKEIQKIMIKHSIVIDEKRFITGIPMGKITECAKELKQAFSLYNVVQAKRTV
tara:strand:- start:39610 stop:39774 length:165 start_codon:yes stop_codon:yes gene_type:complete